MDLEKFIIIYEEFERANENEKKWIEQKLNLIIIAYNEKFKKNINVRF